MNDDKLREAARQIIPHLQSYFTAEGCLNPDVDCKEAFDSPDDYCANHKLERKYQALEAALADTADAPPGPTEEMERLARKAVAKLRQYVNHSSCNCGACIAIAVLDGYHALAAAHKEG